MSEPTGRWFEFDVMGAQYWDSDVCASCFRRLDAYVLMSTEAEDGLLIAKFCEECAAELRDENPQGTHVLGYGP